MNIEECLGKAGLTGNEIKVYLELVRQGSLSANEVAKKIGMDRTLSYTVLNHLIEKGLAKYVIKSNKKFFTATSPENLLNQIKERETIIKDLIPKLKSIKKSKYVAPEVNIYEGKDGIRAIAKLYFLQKKFDTFGATGRLYDYLYEAPAIVKELEKANISGRIITSPKYKNHEMTKIKNMRTKFLDIDTTSTTTISEEFLIIHRIKEKPFAIVIKNKDIVKCYQDYFEVLWSAARD